MTVDPAQIPTHEVAATVKATELEVREARLFTISAAWSDLDIRATEVIPAMYPEKFSRDTYWFDADAIALITRGRK